MGYQNTHMAIPMPHGQKYNPNLHQYNLQSNRKSNCARFLFFLIALIFFVMLITFLSILCFFTFLNLRLPTQTVSSIQVSSIHVNPVSPTVTTNLTLSINSSNPNKRVSIQYRPGAKVSLSYRDATLCNGTVQEFTQPGENYTIIKVAMSGQTEVGPGVRAALMESIAGQEKGYEELRLIIAMSLPITIRFDEKLVIGLLKTVIDSTVDVDNVEPGRKIRILESSYHVTEDYFHLN